MDQDDLICIRCNEQIENELDDSLADYAMDIGYCRFCYEWSSIEESNDNNIKDNNYE